jgi:hypothetical protein
MPYALTSHDPRTHVLSHILCAYAAYRVRWESQQHAFLRTHAIVPTSPPTPSPTPTPPPSITPSPTPMLTSCHRQTHTTLGEAVVPGIVFMRGGAVSILPILTCGGDTFVLLCRQARVPAGFAAFPEIPAGAVHPCARRLSCTRHGCDYPARLGMHPYLVRSAGACRVCCC